MNIPLWLKHRDLAIQQAKQIAEIIRHAPDDAVLERPTIATAGGDERRLRGIPVVGARGVGGAITGTRPGDRC